MVSDKKKIGIIGCGTIGSQLASAIEHKFRSQAELCAICDIDEKKAKALAANCSLKPEILSRDELIASCNLIIEAASGEISYAIARDALNLGKEVMIMSAGGILERAGELFSLARAKGGRIYIPSGALGGLDAVKSASMAKIDTATLITRKPPQGLRDAPYLKEKGIDIDNIKQETLIFEGTAAQAIRGFPQNINVSATLSMLGLGAERTKVKIITSPNYSANIHEIQVEGDFGRLSARVENVPMPENPKTSFLACLSAIATLKNILEVVKIGT